MAQVRANITTAVNASKIRKEKRNGRDVIIVPSATLPDNIVMHRIKYPAEVIEAGYKTLERTPAPLGHPKANGVYINANDPEAINGFWVGAWNENVRREGGRVHLDKVIDIERAESTAEGKELLKAINEQKPIHTSTGLLLAVDDVENDDYDRVATEMLADHDCFLLNQEGAATPDQGVGVFVNSKGEKLEVVESELKLNEELPGSMEDMRRALMDAVEDKYGNGFIDDFNGESVIFFQMDDDKTYKIGYSVMDGKIQISDERQEVQRKTTWEAVTNTIRNTLSKMFGNSPGTTPKAPGLNVNSDEAHQMTPEEMQAALDKQAETLTAAFNAKIDEAVKAAVDPVQEKLTAMNAEREAAAKAEHDKAVEAVVNAKLLEQEEAEALTATALNSLLKATKKAAPLVNGMPVFNGETDTWADYNLNAAMEDK